jgi:hypothetical protein
VESLLAPSPWPRGTPDHEAALKTLGEAQRKHASATLGGELARRRLGPYRGYAELCAALERLGRRGARLGQIGRSVRGEPLFALHLGAATHGPRTRTSVILAGLHPMEWIGIETALALLERLLDGALGDRAVVAVPLANPDGFLRVERNLCRRRRRFVRHNARGVDLNRNFDARWGHRGFAGRLVPWVFRPGSHPASEPEVAAIAHTLGDRRIDRALSLHSFGGAVLYPSAHSHWPVPDADEHRRWAHRIAAEADGRAYRAVPSVWFGLGVTMGGLEMDWLHERHGALALLVECSRGGLGLRPATWLEPFAWFNPPTPHAVAERIARAVEPFVRGAP